MLVTGVILLLLHGPDGREINVSIDKIASVTCKTPHKENKLFVKDVHAVISTTDGKNISVRETCNEVRDLIRKETKNDR